MRKLLQLLNVYKYQLVTFTVLLIFIVFISLQYQQQVFWIRFVDEEDNLALGSYILKGEHLYTNLFSHHQPLGYYISAIVQWITHPNTMFLLIKRHREFIILWSAIWMIILTYRFRWPVVPGIMIYELSKWFLFGNLFLSESIVVYPIMYIASALLLAKQYKNIELIFIGFLTILIQLLLAPAWPYLFVSTIFLFIRTKNKSHTLRYFLSGYIPLVIIVFTFTNYLDYFHDALYINLRYYIPSSGSNLAVDLLKGIFTPVLSLLQKPDSSFSKILSLTNSLFILGSVLMLVQKKISTVLMLWIILGVLNIRYTNPGSQFYSGFHMLPWLGVLGVIVGTITTILRITLQKVYLFLLGVTVICSFYFAQEWFLQNRDINTDYYVNYSRSYDAGNMITILKSPNDRLMVIPDYWLIYWQANINHAAKQLEYYPFNAMTPELNNEIKILFYENKPEFVYMNCVMGCFGLEDYLSQYTRLYKVDAPTDLYVLPKKLDGLTQSQKKELEFHKVYWY
jgi:hypothetical protein